jgi:mRNA-binding protein PUF3
LGQLKDAEREALIDQIKPLLSQLKKFSYGKQIVAIEKLIFDPNSPATGLSHTTSTTPPHSHKSSPQPLKRTIPTEQPRAFGNAPPTPPPTEAQPTVDSTLEPKGLAKSTVTSVSSPETGNTGVTVPVDVTSAH